MQYLQSTLMVPSMALRLAVKSQRYSGLSTFENCLAWETKKLVFCTHQIVQFHLLEKVTSKKRVVGALLFLLLLTYICMQKILYVSQLFTGEIFVMLEILYSWRVRGRNSVRWKTPSQCGRVDSPAVLRYMRPTHIAGQEESGCVHIGCVCVISHSLWKHTGFLMGPELDKLSMPGFKILY